MFVCVVVCGCAYVCVCLSVYVCVNSSAWEFLCGGGYTHILPFELNRSGHRPGLALYLAAPAPVPPRVRYITHCRAANSRGVRARAGIRKTDQTAKACGHRAKAYAACVTLPLFYCGSEIARPDPTEARLTRTQQYTHAQAHTVARAIEPARAHTHTATYTRTRTQNSELKHAFENA